MAPIIKFSINFSLNTSPDLHVQNYSLWPGHVLQSRQLERVVHGIGVEGGSLGHVGQVANAA